MTQTPIVEFRNLGKEFSGTRVLRGVELKFERGEVHGLLGENGAGKSTLIKILTGVYSHSEGEIIVEGKPVTIKSPMDAHKLGLGAVYQDAELIGSFTVAQNVVLGGEPGRFTINRKAIRDQGAKILKEIGLTLDPDRIASSLSAAESQLVILATLFQRKYKLIVLDEPTARLSASEAELLFRLIRRFQEEGITIIYISHRLGEIRQLCDRITILRGGRVSATLAGADITEERVTELMVDRTKNELEVFNPGLARPEGMLQVVELSCDQLSPLSFDVHAGEVLGITGPVGGGMELVARAVAGLVPHHGEIKIAGQTTDLSSPSKALEAGIALIPEDRRKQALFPNMSAADNIALPVLSRLSRGGFISDRAKLTYAEQVIKRLQVKPDTPGKAMKFFSGGNQQKAVIGKWLSAKCRIYIFVEPTSGVDVGAIRDIYEIMLGLAREGAAVILVSSSMREIMALSENVIVIRDGKAIYRAPKAKCTHDQLLGISMTGRVA
ncbi:sugar ABC transporter ATP-binding protein [Hypericibacter sp.]|uniref:sugar ABC transporter ATP-binding protein n=1 Tax=Hypericibacter sp. TaxID=2705401 RepID=UPI003D6CB65E